MSAPAPAPMPPPAIALVFSPEPWVEALHRHLVDHGGARVRQIVLEPSVAFDEEYDTLVVSHRWPALSRVFVDRLHASGRRVLGVFDPDEPAGRDHLNTLGVDVVLAADAGPDAFVSVLERLGRSRGASTRPRSELALVGTSPAPCPTSASPVTVVSGPAGSGATEVAIELARAVSTRVRDVVLVDADARAASVAVRLGLAPEPNLRTALDALVLGDTPLEASLVVPAGGRLRVLPGLPSPRAAAHVRGNQIADALVALCGLADHVVVDAAAPGDPVSDVVLASATAVVGVGHSAPVGVARLLGWVGDVKEHAAVTAVHLVLNRAPRDRFRRQEIASELTSSVAPASLTFVPDDPRVVAAAWDGRFVGRGAFSSALAGLVEQLAPLVSRGGERHAIRTRALAIASSRLVNPS